MFLNRVYSPIHTHSFRVKCHASDGEAASSARASAASRGSAAPRRARCRAASSCRAVIWLSPIARASCASSKPTGCVVGAGSAPAGCAALGSGARSTGTCGDGGVRGRAG